MRTLMLLFLLTASAVAQAAAPQLPADDATRIREFYRLVAEIQDKVWPNWSATPAPLLLVTADAEFLTHYDAPPADFKKTADDLYARPRQFGTSMQATFPAFGANSVIVIGEPKNTLSQTSTPWLATLMHEHFHQLQNGRPGYFAATEALGLSHGDTSGMWMLNYPFPYENPEAVRGFAHLRDSLLMTLGTEDDKEFAKLAGHYVEERKKFFAQFSADDHKYFSFQLWNEGVARYIQVKSAEAAAQHQPTPEYAALPDYEPFPVYAAHARKDTLEELKQADLAKWKRIVVYSFGGAECLLLDRLNPGWKDQYFARMLSTDSYFEALAGEAVPGKSVRGR
jgi:hypothetical protein